MVTIDEAEQMLDEIAEEIPRAFYTGLNGGILLLPEKKISNHAKRDDLLILGEYVRDRSMGRLIKIYYGSFQKVYGHLDGEAFKEELRETLFHEFTHHVESLAGEKGLEIWDEEQLQKYLRKK